MGMIDAVKIMCDAELKAESNKITLGEYEAMIRPLRQVMTKADYENRLKADMVAMLTGLSMKIGEIEDGYTEFDEENKRSLTMIPLESVERLIDGEINSLEEA